VNGYEIGTMAKSLHSSYEFYFGKRCKRGEQVPTLAKQETKPMPHPTPFRAFHNALRILRALDFHEVYFLTDAEWEKFRDNPYDFFITTSDSNALQIWRALQARQPADLKEPSTPESKENG
jgi:hypothetical protein